MLWLQCQRNRLPCTRLIFSVPAQTLSYQDDIWHGLALDGSGNLLQKSVNLSLDQAFICKNYSRLGKWRNACHWRKGSSVKLFITGKIQRLFRERDQRWISRCTENKACQEHLTKAAVAGIIPREDIFQNRLGTLLQLFADTILQV